jgi:tetratricopeptide (TPR) repeat protein
MKLKLRNLFGVNWWKCSYRYTRGVIRYVYGKYNSSIDDFQWILENGAFAPMSCLIYENLGINYARLKDFTKAEEYFIKSSSDKSQEDNGYLFMWLGYIHLINNRHEQALDCFRKARERGRAGYQRWLVQEKYVQERINLLEAEIRKKYTDIFSSN